MSVTLLQVQGGDAEENLELELLLIVVTIDVTVVLHTVFVTLAHSDRTKRNTRTHFSGVARL